MSKADGQRSTNAFSRIVDLLAEHRIKLDTLEHVLIETNPLAHRPIAGTWNRRNGDRVTFDTIYNYEGTCRVDADTARWRKSRLKPKPEL